MDSSNVNKLSNISVLCLLLTILHCCPRSTVACTSCENDVCPGSAEKTLSLLQRFKEFNNDVTNKTVLFRLYGLWGIYALSATESKVNVIKIPGGDLKCAGPEHEQFFFYMYQYTVNGTRMVSLVSVASPELIVTSRPVDVGSGYSGDNDVPIMYELKTENITKIFSMMSSNTTDYDINWRFQLDHIENPSDHNYIYAKILTENGDLAVTYHYDDDSTTLQSVISGSSPGNDFQGFIMCNDCREYQ